MNPNPKQVFHYVSPKEVEKIATTAKVNRPTGIVALNLAGLKY